MARLVFVDNLKLYLIILVILHHVAVAYGGGGEWPILETATDPISPIIFTLFNALNQSFFMGLFFLLSGFFTVGSLARKGKVKFVKDRLVRLGIPLVGYTILIAPIVDYLVLNYSMGKDVSFFEAFSFGWAVGPLWFVEALLILSLIYVLFNSKKTLVLFKDRFPSTSSIVLVMVILAILTFLVRIMFPIGVLVHVFQVAHYVSYIFAFFIGIIAYNNGWFEHLGNVRLWKIVAIVSIITLPIIFTIGMMLSGGDINVFMGGFGWQSLLLSFWETIAGISIIISLLSIFKKRFDTQGRLARWASPNYYGAYIFHAIVIVSLMVPLLGVAIPSSLKALIVAILAVPLCFIVTALVRKLPFVNKVIG
ncbi:MAG: acyltransferase family protein [bacterium]|nr:acyltransferase family protein [bacterium]